MSKFMRAFAVVLIVLEAALAASLVAIGVAHAATPAAAAVILPISR